MRFKFFGNRGTKKSNLETKDQTFNFFEKIAELRDWNRSCWSVDVYFDLTVDLAPPMAISVNHMGKRVFYRQTSIAACNESLYNEIVAILPKARSE